jgi:hypothetical protein
MIPSLSRGLRLALVLSLGVIGAVRPFHVQAAHAGKNDDEEEDDEDQEESDDEGEEEDDSSQPAVTAGGLYTLKTYPLSELQRPLTITQGLTQIRAGFGFDVSAKTAFETVGADLAFEYGLQDHFSLLGGINGQYNFKQFEVYGGIEGALAYDLIDVRVAGVAKRPKGGKTKVSADLGFPFRYAAKPEIAIIALDTLLGINFDSKPDLKPSLGISTNPIPAVSVVVFATLIIPRFDTDAANFVVPATARVQFSPSQKLDLGAEFTFLNLKPPKPADGTPEKKFYDDRFLTLYAAFRM